MMAWIFDTYSMNKGHSVLGVVTGKPLAIGGSLGREEATGRGVMFCLVDDAAAARRVARRGCRSRCRGSATSARTFARFAAEDGAKVVAVSDSTGGVYNANGRRHRGASRTSAAAARSPSSRAATRSPTTSCSLLDCDVLAPCALEQVITDGQRRPGAGRRIVVEGANGPVTPTADEILEGNGVLVLPDVLANAGGVIVSYFEWVQGLQEYFWNEDEVNERLNEIVVRAFDETWAPIEQRETLDAHGRLRPRQCSASPRRA